MKVINEKKDKRSRKRPWKRGC